MTSVIEDLPEGVLILDPRLKQVLITNLEARRLLQWEDSIYTEAESVS
jgi:hypothetical protein